MADFRATPPRCEFEMDQLVIKLDEIVPAVVSMIDHTVMKITSLIRQSPGWDDTENLDLVLREALANAILHGNRSNPHSAVRICVALQADCGVLIMVKDVGIGFDPTQLPNPLVGENLFAGHGRGIFLINQLMENVQFKFGAGTEIHMRRTLRRRERDDQ